MKTNIESNGYFITSPGDESVGIFSAQWEIKGFFGFNEETEEKEFRTLLLDAFSVVADPCYIESFEERSERTKKEDEMMLGSIRSES